MDHSITVMDSARETNATLTVTYETCFDDDPEDLELRYTYSPEDGTSNPPSPVQFGSSVMDLTNVTTTIEIQGLMDSTTYEYTVSLVRTVGGGTIGKTISADFHTGGRLIYNECDPPGRELKMFIEIVYIMLSW